MVTSSSQGSQAGPARGAGAAHVRAAAAAPDPPAQRRGAAGKGLVARAKALFAWWQSTRPARANARFGARGGGLLTGGIAYAALFSVFAGLTLGWTVFMAVLGGDQELRTQVLDAVNDSLPGIVDTGDNGGLIDPDSLVLSTGLTIAGIVAVVVLLFSALSATSALRTATRAMFAPDEGPTENAVLGKLRELGGLVAIAFAVLVAAVLTTAVTAAAQWLLGALGWGGATTVVLRVVGILVAFVVDAGTFVLVVRLLAGEDPPRRDLLGGAAIAGVGIGVVRVLGTSVVAGSAGRNPLLASFAVIATLLVWMNLLARIVLLAAAWTANPPAPKQSAQGAAGEDATGVEQATRVDDAAQRGAGPDAVERGADPEAAAREGRDVRTRG